MLLALDATLSANKPPENSQQVFNKKRHVTMLNQPSHHKSFNLVENSFYKSKGHSIHILSVAIIQALYQTVVGRIMAKIYQLI